MREALAKQSQLPSAARATWWCSCAGDGTRNSTSGTGGVTYTRRERD